MLRCCVKLGELLSDKSIQNLSSSSLCPFVHLAIVRVPPPTVVSGIVGADDVVLLVVFEAVGGERRAPPSPRGILGIPKHPLPPRRPHRRGRGAGPAASTFVLVFVTKFNFHSPPSFSPPPFLIGFLSLLKNFSSSALCRRDSALRGERGGIHGFQ